MNTPGVGGEYETFVPAYIALLLTKNKKVKNFRLRKAVESFGNLNYMVIDIELEGGEPLHFCLELKHKEDDNFQISPESFTEVKYRNNKPQYNNYSLEKYCNAFMKIEEKNKKYHFILYTNSNFDHESTKDVKDFDMTTDDRCKGKPYFNTNSTSKSIYKFEINDSTKEIGTVREDDFRKFFSKFTLYTNQNNFKNFKEKIVGNFESEEMALKYEELFRGWHQGIFTDKTVDKKTISIHLIDIMLSSYIIKNHHLSITSSENLKLFDRAIRQFDVSVVSDSKDNFIREFEESEVQQHLEKQLNDCMKIHIIETVPDPNPYTTMAQNFKIIPKSATKLQPEDKLKLLHCFCEKPLLVVFDEKSKPLIYEVVESCQLKVNKIKLVLVGEGVDTTKFSNLKTFRYLSDLQEANDKLYQEVIKWQVSLQGREKICLRDLITSCEDIGKFLGTKELFKLSKGDCQLGEEILVDTNTTRRVSTICLDVEQVLDYVSKNPTEKMIINCDGKFELIQDLLERKEMEVSEIDQSLTHNILISKTRNCTRMDFDRVRQESDNCNLHLVKIFDQSSFMVLITTDNTLKRFKFRRVAIPEEDIHLQFTGPVNVICAQPGMGKTTMLRRLRKSCCSEYWTLEVGLRSHNSLLKQELESEELLQKFLELQDGKDQFINKLTEDFLKRKKIVIFLDGLDEVEPSCVDRVLKWVQDLSREDYRVWLTSRKNLEDKLEADLNIFTIDIEELSEAQQQEYVNSCLKQKYEEDEIKNIIAKLANNLKVFGVPVQLSIITQILVNTDDNLVVLGKLCKSLLDGKYEFLNKKLGLENQQLDPYELEDGLENYGIAALQSCLNREDFEKLKLDLRRYQRFLVGFKERGDPLGIVIKLDKDDKPVFEDRTFAEYFAWTFLENNPDLLEDEQLRTWWSKLTTLMEESHYLR